jgi:hypothetical protein
MASKLLPGSKRTAKKSVKPLVSVHGQEVARLSLAKTTMSKEEAVESLLNFGKDNTLGKSVSIRELIEEGRRYLLPPVQA